VCRGALLAVLGTVVGVLVLWVIPTSVADAVNLRLPTWYVDGQGAVLTIASVICNSVTTILFR
jgi:predicted CDP-diglyceride synthetase/phosphatidate cytidylyltransferase